MNKLKRIVEVLKEYFITILKKQKLQLPEAKNEDEEFEFNNTESSIDLEEYDDIEAFDGVIDDLKDIEMNKKDFFILYENVKKGIVKLEDLMIFDVLKIQLMMKNELDFINEKITNSEKKLRKIKLTLKRLNEEKDRYYRKLQNNNQ